jgi:hypothetical protein
MSPRSRLLSGVLTAVTLASVVAAAPARAEFAPPWCGTPVTDAAENLPDGTDPADPPGSFPHIPYYAVRCTLDDIAARSDGRMEVDVIGQSALGRDLYQVTINALGTRAQREGFRNWQSIRAQAMKDPVRARRALDRFGANVKVPLFVQSGIHGNEYEGVDAAMQVIEKLATTPYGTDREVDLVLDRSVVVFNVVQNPDGRVAGTRANGNGFDLNRDYLTQSQPETQASVAIMQEWLPPDVLDLHGYVTPTLVEGTTKPHNPSIEYDLWLEWNQGRIGANREALAAEGLDITVPITDWCAEGDEPGPDGLCEDGNPPGPAVAEGWDDWGPFYTAMYAQHVGLNASTVEMCNSVTQACAVEGVTLPNDKLGRLGARLAQVQVTWSTLVYDTERRRELLADQLEFYRRGVVNAPRPECCPPPFDEANNWMHEYPTAFVIPMGAGQRSQPEANRLVDWLLAQGVVVEKARRDFRFDGKTYEEGSYVVWMTQARRGLVDTALGIGVDISDDIGQLYAPPAAWSHGYLWGASVDLIPRGANFSPRTDPIKKSTRIRGGVEAGRADAYALVVDSPTAVRTLNRLLADGVPARQATAAFDSTTAGTLPAGSAIFAADRATQRKLKAAGRASGIWFHRLSTTVAPLPPAEPIDGVPNVVVLTGTANQDVWTLRNLGFPTDFVSTGQLQTLPENPLPAYDLIWNSGTWPASTNPTARERLAAFFAAGGGYLGAGFNGTGFAADGGLVTGLTAAARPGSGRSAIVNWLNTGGPASVVTGAYPPADTAIVDPPTWFTAVPPAWSVDARLPGLPWSNIVASGFWPQDAESATAAGSALVAHGGSTAGPARLSMFAMNPLYRADPEREWPMVATSAYWVDQ